jgi:hypothetical protein
MLYCDECANKRDWPITGFKSHGQCEICNKVKPCNDRPSKDLPIPSKKKRKLNVNWLYTNKNFLHTFI